VNTYNREQAETIVMVRGHLAAMSPTERKGIESLTQSYLEFREDVDRFLLEHIAPVCERKCYESGVSACCTREGIVTFFADVVVNALYSSDAQIDGLLDALQRARQDFACAYLGQRGCLWQIRPVVCAMFLCRGVQEEVVESQPSVRQHWERLKTREKAYTWPDRPVLFESLEVLFMERGCSSPLMFMHNSPGLLRVRARRKGDPVTAGGCGRGTGAPGSRRRMK